MCFFVKYLFCITFCFSLVYGDKPLVLPWLNIKSEVSTKVQEFLNAEESSTSIIKKVSTKHDVLGRNQNGVSTYVTSPEYKKMKVSVVYRDVPQFCGQPHFARFDSDENRFYLNDTLLSEKIFFDKTANYGQKCEEVPSDFIADLTAAEIRSLLQGDYHVLIQDVPVSNPLQETSSGDFIPYTDVLNLSGISRYAHSNGYNGNGITACVSESDCPNTQYINTSNFVQHKTDCSGNTGFHITKMVDLFQKTAPGAVLHEFNQNTNPNPTQNGIVCDVGFRSEGFSNRSDYSGYDEELDNYINRNGMIVFVSAGNQYDSSGAYYVSSPGKALNAITVGAVSPRTGLYNSFSRWDNSNIGNQKPEVLNYSDFDLLRNATFVDSNGNVYNGRSSGTSSATAYTAGLMANVLQQHPFFKRHPEMAKALLITGSTKSVSNYAFDADNYSKAARAVPLYQKLAWSTRSAYWNGSNSDFFVGDSISFNESEIVAGKRYRVAISWLTPGSYITENQTISQDLDLYVYQDDRIIAKSFSAKNPFEVVDFVATSNSDLRIKIHRYANSGVGDIKLGYNMWFGY